MTDQQSRPAASQGAGPGAPTAAPKPKSWVTRISAIVIGAVAVILLGVQVLKYFVLPGCDASNVTQTLREIYAKQNVKVERVSDIKTLSDASAEKVCQAELETTGEKMLIEYNISWQGWSAYVTSRRKLRS